jgi:hypothetical protein
MGSGRENLQANAAEIFPLELLLDEGNISWDCFGTFYGNYTV